MLSGIYSITCLSNGKVYVGSSNNIPARWKKHRYLLKVGRHSNCHLQNCFHLYGEDSLNFEVLEDLSGSSAKTILEREQYYLDSLDWNESLNICQDARGGKVTPEANERRKESLRRYHQENPEALLGARNPFFSRKHDQKAKDDISRANTGRKRSEEFKKNKSILMSQRKGLHHSEEHKNKLSEKYSGAGNPMAIEVSIGGVTYPTKKEALKALGLKYNYQLENLLNAERLSREGVEPSGSKRVPPCDTQG